MPGPSDVPRGKILQVKAALLAQIKYNCALSKTLR